MSRLKKYSMFFTLSFILGYSCSKEVDVDFPEFEIKPVVNCLFTPGNPFLVYVGLSQKTEDSIKTIVSNAIISITDEKGVSYLLKHLGKGQYTNVGLIAEKGLKYTLSVKIPEFGEVVASGSIPDSKTKTTRITSIPGTRPAPVYGTGDTGTMDVEDIELYFFNDLNAEDLMGICILSHVTIMISDENGSRREELKNEIKSNKIYSNELAIMKEGLGNYENKSIELFKDEYIKNENAKLRVAFEKSLKTRYWIRFFRFSPEAFKYTKSWIAHENTRNYDFWEIYEPEPLYSNIENGYGIFAGYEWHSFEIIPGSDTNYP